MSAFTSADGDLFNVCGKYGGVAFQNITRVDDAGACPSDYEPCIPTADQDNIICYPSGTLDDNCPITDIQVIKNADQQTYIDSEFEYKFLTIDSTQMLAYSKLVNQLPTTSIALESRPCIDPSYQSQSTG